MKRNTNELIRKAQEKTGIRQWQIADLLNIREDVFSKMMRYELDIDEQHKIVTLIEKWSNTNG